LNSFRLYTDLLEDKAKIIPNYVLWYNPGAEYGGWNFDDPNCYSGGKYCSPDPGN